MPLIAGFGLAAKLADAEQDKRREASEAIRREALAAFAHLSPHVHGNPELGVLPHILSIAILGVDSEAVMVAAKELVAISNGSACTSARYAPSHVLTAMGLEADVVDGTIRISWAHTSENVPWTDLAQRIGDLRF